MVHLSSGVEEQTPGGAVEASDRHRAQKREKRTHTHIYGGETQKESETEVDGDSGPNVEL